ncbi:outer membrane protein OmpV [Grimontia hollisae]|uniref:outer membrane protein OmpV n=1 Tax=Grimontia hollisae TaxID=673 RepID=UPI000E04A087|nr:MipA/OmpV family protein [Grimontia hollisae]STQ75691.1 Outer membrane protein ompV precursor [Grimontia hollisae]
MKKTAVLLSTFATAPAVQAAGETYILNGNIYTKQNSWIAEAGAAITNYLYKEQKHSVVPFINFGYHGEDINVDFSGINYRFYKTTNETINLGAYLTSAGISYDHNTSDFLKGMDDRHLSVDLGLNADFHLNDGVVSTYFQHDISGTYQGYLAGVEYFHMLSVGVADLVPYASVTFQSKDFIDYYFGVQPYEARVNRPKYSGSSSISYDLGYKLIYPINQRWNLTQSAQYTRIGDESADSPIVDSANQWLVGAAVSYHF